MTIRESLRKPFVSAPVAERVDLSGKQMIVTGCGVGSLGYATARQLASWGAAPLERLLMASAAEGAQTQIYCASSMEAKSGHYYANGHIAKSSEDSLDETSAGRLWEETQAWLRTGT